MTALQLHVTGIVQGVGFRPFVFNLAVSQGLTGWVLNASDGVHCVVEGEAALVAAFPETLRAAAPAMSAIESIVTEAVEPEGFTTFEIRESYAEAGAMTLVSPDIATCPECLADLTNPDDRRHGYPFTNCTNCGPRFTIIDDVPYDRPMTTMRDFPMCPECEAEYADPANRRFHAQPNACFVCGPRLYLNAPASPDGWLWAPSVEVAPRPHRDRATEATRSEEILGEVVRRLQGGQIVAIKGLGGFHLACDARDSDAVGRLRERKHRWGKPLAVMVPNLAAAQQMCRIDETEASLLTGTVQPIVLVRRRVEDTSLALGVADGLTEIGVMLPYTPLHHLLLARVGGPLVMTSGNLSDEPIATDNSEALERLASVADAFLLHDREIHSRYDDSVVRVVNGLIEPVRRARGYAPHPIKLPFKTDTHILAIGPEQKNTFTLLKDDYAFVSQHIGDLENAETLQSLEHTMALYEHLFRVEPHVIAHDLHPEYLSTKWALASPLPKVAVQHHHAHVVSVSAEHGISEPVVGFAFDGTGYGEDGRIWGGEVLLADWEGYERLAHLRYVPMPGGAAAIRRPARMAVGTLHALGLLEHPGAAPLRSRLADGEERTLIAMIDGNINCPLTSSMGRLFDTVAALTGVADDARYEGEAAIRLEACADPDETGAYEFGLIEPGGPGEPLIIDPVPVLDAVLRDVAAADGAGVISARFHRAVVRCIVRLGADFARNAPARHVAFGGGVFMNRIVLGESVRKVQAAGLVPLTHVKLPTNDAAVSFGQAVVAWARRRSE
ncbi:MAG: carbamoyltransferase HypF [Coriobacteriia bacterium]|nr:carbamoyltransferase HypF [Coriobacteriia bacterium]